MIAWGLYRSFSGDLPSLPPVAERYDELREIASRHGIKISATRVRKIDEHYGAEKEKTRAWRRILEQTTGTLLRQSAGQQ